MPGEKSNCGENEIASKDSFIKVAPGCAPQSRLVQTSTEEIFKLTVRLLKNDFFFSSFALKLHSIFDLESGVFCLV